MVEVLDEDIAEACRLGSFAWHPSTVRMRPEGSVDRSIMAHARTIAKLRVAEGALQIVADHSKDPKSAWAALEALTAIRSEK
jgi:hypothetical protein